MLGVGSAYAYPLKSGKIGEEIILIILLDYLFVKEPKFVKQIFTNKKIHLPHSHSHSLSRGWLLRQPPHSTHPTFNKILILKILHY